MKPGLPERTVAWVLNVGSITSGAVMVAVVLWRLIATGLHGPDHLPALHVGSYLLGGDSRKLLSGHAFHLSQRGEGVAGRISNRRAAGL